MVSRKLSRTKYLIAAGITAAIFFSGFFLGLVVENKRVDLMDTLYKEHTVAFSSSQLQFDYLNEIIGEESCDLVFDSYHRALEDLGKTTEKLEKYSETEKINEGEFDLLKREYLLSEIKFWLLARKIKERCHVDMMPVMYFHTKKEFCPDCDEQSFILNYLKKKYGQRLLIFSFNTYDANEPMIELLKSAHDIKELPTVIIGDKKFDGFTSKDELELAICEKYVDKTDCPSPEEIAEIEEELEQEMQEDENEESEKMEIVREPISTE
ncbi:hypothetical protein KY340_04380 [Candidatus Woesearchaeota archaeon]|nr:hypothetical protein [Candidatus Woesearchaeota archaeon]